MATDETNFLNLKKPVPGSERGLWGFDLNQNFDTLDAAVRTLTENKVREGTYTGNGTNDRLIGTGLAYPPKVIAIMSTSGLMVFKTSSAPNKQFSNTIDSVDTLHGIAIVNNDFTVDDTHVGLNTNLVTYYWFVLA